METTEMETAIESRVEDYESIMHLRAKFRLDLEAICKKVNISSIYIIM